MSVFIYLFKHLNFLCEKDTQLREKQIDGNQKDIILARPPALIICVILKLFVFLGPQILHMQ